MGGGMIYGEPYSYGFGYPASGTPGYNSVFPTRSQARFSGNELYPDDEVTNLARKRKLHGVKGDALNVSNVKNGKNVREILVEDPFATRIPRAHGSQAEGNASNSGGNSPPPSPRFGNGSMNHKSSEGHTVTIPVVFSSEAATQQPVSVVPVEGTKKPRKSLSEEEAAVLIQSTYKGYEVRRTKPLEHMRRINNIRSKLKEFERRLSDAEMIERLKTDLNVKLRITEGIMALLLELDSIQGVHSDVRIWRKAVTREVVTLQERVDAVLKGEERLETQSLSGEPSVEGQDEDTPIAVDDVNVGKNNENDEVMTEIEHQKTPLETEEKLAVETVLDRLKLVDGEAAVSQLEDMAVVKDDHDHVDEVSDLQNDQSITTIRNAIAQQESGEEERQTESTFRDADKNEVAQKAKLRTRQPMNDNCEVFTVTTRGRDDEFRHETFISCAVDEANVAYDNRNDGAIQMKSSEAPDTMVAITMVNGEQGMEVDIEDSHTRDEDDEYVRTSEDFDYTMRRRPQDQVRMKDFLKEITSPSVSPDPHRVRLNEAEEMDCHGAPSTCSDFEENAVVPIPHNVRMNRAEETDCRAAPCTSPDFGENDVTVPGTGPRTPHESDDAEGATTSRRTTEGPEHDHLLLKLSEENKMLKSLLLDIMTWNQFQANSMKNVTERLGKLEDHLTKRKSSARPKLHKCTRSKLERRSRR